MKRLYRPTLLIFLLLPFFFYACGDANKETEDYDDQTLPDSVNTDGMANPFFISPKGLFFVGLGQQLEDMDTIVPEMGVLQDSIVYDQGYYLATRTLHLEDGQVVIEGEYVSEEGFDQMTIAQSKVNRIRIHSPSFRTKEGLSAGMTLEKLAKTFPGETFYINPMMDYQAIDISGAFDLHIHYLISDPDNAISRSATDSELTLADLPASEKISAIVLMR